MFLSSDFDIFFKRFWLSAIADHLHQNRGFRKFCLKSPTTITVWLQRGSDGYYAFNLSSIYSYHFHNLAFLKFYRHQNKAVRRSRILAVLYPQFRDKYWVTTWFQLHNQSKYMCLTLFGIMLNSAFYRDDTCPCCLFYFTLAIHSNGVCKGRDERKLSTFSGCHETWRTSVGFLPFLRRVNTKANENVLLITEDIIRSFSSAAKQTSPINVTHSRHT